MIVLILLIIVCIVTWGVVLRCCYKATDGDGIGFVYGFTAIPRACCYVAFGFAIYNNCIQIESRHQSYLNERVVLVEKLNYFKNYGTDWRKNENAVTEYSSTLNEINDFNSKIYSIKYNKNDPWIGLFLDKAYVNIEPIDIGQN